MAAISPFIRFYHFWDKMQADRQVATGGKEQADKEYFNKSKLYLGFERIL